MHQGQRGIAVRKVLRIGGNAHKQKNKIYEDIRELSNSKTKSPIGGCRTSKDGKILFETEEIKKRWNEYTTELFEDNRPTKPEHHPT